MRRITGIILCIAVLISCLTVGAGAAEKKDDAPIVLISGFLCSQLYANYGEENEEKVWGLDTSKITERIGDDFPNFALNLMGLLIGRNAEFGETIGEGAAYVLEMLRCNPDGSSVYPLGHYPNNPETSSIKYMLENDIDNLYEKSFCQYLSEETDPSRVFCFQYDSRLDAVTVARQLHSFIADIKEYTGSDKVKIFSLSFGGLISSTYLALYSDENDIERLVMSVPALGGTNIPDRLLRGEIELSPESIVSFFETILGSESNLARLFENNDFARLNEILCGASGGLSSSLKYWGSIWSLCSADLYEDLKKDFLDPAESKAIIEKNDILHYQIMPSFPEVFRENIKKGVSISIICGSGSPIAAGGELNGDLVLPVSSVTGVRCAPLGERFPEGYSGIGTVCSDKSHNHISPSMEVDASCAYLPENTWFVDSHYHGQYFYEDYTRSLVTKLLLTDEINDIRSDPAYPQFEYSSHAYRTLHASFDKSSTGYLSSEDSRLIVKNLGTADKIRILSVVSNGVELDFDCSGLGIISPGESVSIPFKGDVPKVGSKPAQITVSYIKFGSANPLCVSDFDIMIDNGEAAGFKSGFVSADFESRLEAAVPASIYRVIVRLSLRQSFECLYNSLTAAFD